MQLSNFERKLITILQHNNKRGKVPSIRELEVRLGHTPGDIKECINDLIKRCWIVERDGEWIVKNKPF